MTDPGSPSGDSPDLRSAARRGTNWAVGQELPPSSRTSELGILGCCIVDNRLVAGLRDSWFYNVDAKRLYEVIARLASSGRPFDVVTVAEAMGDVSPGNEALDRFSVAQASYALNEGIGPSFFKTHAAVLADLARKRELLRIASQSVDAVYAPLTDGASILGDVEAASRELRLAEPDEVQDMTAREATLALVDQYEAAYNGTAPRGITTGFVELDQITGPLMPGQLVIVAARPGVGKTALALNISERVAVEERQGVGIVSLEMTPSQLVHRLISSRSRIDSKRLANQKELAEDELALVSDVSADVARAPIFMADKPLTVQAITATAKRWRMDRDIKLLVIDYLQLISAGSRGKSRYEDISTISNAIKRLALELDVPVLCLAQLNRASESENRAPRMSDLRDSGAIEQDADIAILLHQQIGTGEGPTVDPSRVVVTVAKNRSGPVGRTALRFRGEITRFFQL